MFNNVYLGKKVLITGHTGFKGSWLSSWLSMLGAEVVGFSNSRPSEPCMFDKLQLSDLVKDIEGDLRDLDLLRVTIDREKPDFIFHLGAQAIVSKSYEDPIETISTNVMGMANVLECLRNVSWPLNLIAITSDKSYDNVEWVWGYKETDTLGGKDIYSGSKGAADLIFRSYVESFLAQHPFIRCAVARAGNVIGGGDWAKDRIVVDAFDSWSRGESVAIRCPDATRPWQHVLEPLSGYLVLGKALSEGNIDNGEAYNFGPRAEKSRTVIQLLDSLWRLWNRSLPNQPYNVVDKTPFNEASLLRLNCDKALHDLGWEAVFDYEDTMNATAEWYVKFHEGHSSLLEFTRAQILQYSEMARVRGLEWAACEIS